MIEAKIVLRALKALLDRPPQTGGTGKFGQPGLLWREGEIIVPLVGFPPVAPDQYPTLEAFFATPWQGNPRTIVQVQSLGAFARRMGRPSFGVQRAGQFLRQM